jgi:hypothetical protein
MAINPLRDAISRHGFAKLELEAAVKALQTEADRLLSGSPPSARKMLDEKVSSDALVKLFTGDFPQLNFVLRENRLDDYGFQTFEEAQAALGALQTAWSRDLKVSWNLWEADGKLDCYIGHLPPSSEIDCSEGG